MGLSLALCVLGLVSIVVSVSYDPSSASSIKEAAKTVAQGMMSYYSGNLPGGTPGLFPYPPYYWWESGSAFGHLVDYYYYTGDAQWNDVTIQATTWQAQMNGQFMPSNQTFDMGNDDQAFWAFTAMNAAETNFPPPTAGYPSWSTMCDIVFNMQVSRWDTQTCGGGLHWQVFIGNAGYNYKNVAANGAFMMLAARLARYSGNNNTYVQWVEKAWAWMEQSPIIDSSNGTVWRVYDGTQIGGDCKKAEETQWSYNYGLLIGGLAYIYNHTQDEKWLTPLYGILNGTIDIFFNADKIMIEAACEPNNRCQTQPNWTTFLSFTIRWLAVTTQLVPALADTLWPYIEASAKGAAGQCDGNGGSVCGYHWPTTTWDGTSGLGQQMSALAAIGAPMIQLMNLAPPLTLATGAKSNVSLNGTFGSGNSGSPWLYKPITTADRAAAGVVTAVLIIATLAVGWSLS